MKFTLALMTICCLVIPAQIHAQGCLGGDSDEEGMQIAGFFQPEFGYQFSEDEDSHSFSLKRARVAFFGNIPYDISYYMCLEFSQFILAENTGVLDAFISYSRLGPYAKLTLGQFKAPFSLEQNTACSGLHTIKRSGVVDYLASPQRDIGLMISGAHEDFLKYDLAFMNGTGIATKDNNTNKNIVGRLRVTPMECITLGGSYRYGTNPPVASGVEDEDERTRYGGELELTYDDLLVQAEYIVGEDKGSYTTGGGCGGEPVEIVEGSVDRAGMFVMALYMTPWNIQPVLKYESWDPNTDEDDDKVQITTFGFNYFLNDWTRLQFNYLYKAEDVEVGNDEMLLQLQVKF